MDRKKKITSYQTPSAIKYITSGFYVITAVIMAILPSYTCVYDAGGYKFGISGALGELETNAGFTIWLLMYACMIAGLAFAFNDKTKIIPVITSCYLTFATFYSRQVLGTTKKDLELNYSMENNFYIVVAANIILVVLTVIVLIKTKKVVEEKNLVVLEIKSDEKSSQQ